MHTLDKKSNASGKAINLFKSKRLGMFEDLNMIQERDEYKIQIKMPDQNLEDISLELTDSRFCLSIGEESQCFVLSHSVNVDDSRAAYDGDTLYLEMPIKFPIHGKRMEIEKGCLDMGEGKHSCV